jgi:hypothetical protein
MMLFLPDVFAQISEGGTPPSFKYAETLRRAVEKTEAPVDFYGKDLLETDNWRAREGAPMPVAKLIPVDYAVEQAGVRTTLPGGERIRQFHLSVPGAVAVMLYYRDFYIPEGGKLFIYSADKTQLLGAYTKNTHPSGGLFATEFVGGDELILEYVESDASLESPRIHIDNIGYGYNASALQSFCGITVRAAAASCMVNVNCEEGAAWQNEKKSVCHMVQRIGKASYICTGALMNNTAEDFTPLILTARHCATYIEGRGATTVEVTADGDDMLQWLFYFHREREGCSNASLAAEEKTMTGCTLLVNTGTGGGSDGMLLLLTDMIPDDYDVFYSGWDHSDAPASSGVNIHHPQGDYMKISTYNTPVREVTFVSSEFTGHNYAHWNVTFQQTANGHGVTEGGSSGSPLFNENKLVVGTLTGGDSSCGVPLGRNIYGKMSYHWNQFAGDDAHMDVWLDPTGSGVSALAGRFRKVLSPAPVGVKAVNQGQSILITWDPPVNADSPAHYNVYRNNQKMGETLSTSFTDNAPLAGSIVFAVSAVYPDGAESAFASATLSFVKYKAPSDFKAEWTGVSNRVKLSWKAPVYEQLIYWGALELSHGVGFDGNEPFYYGQRWSNEEIAPLDGTVIKAIQFAPWENNTYSIYISQGDQSYRQPIESSSLLYNNRQTVRRGDFHINTIELNEPFRIDGSKSLIVSVHLTSVGYDFPATCDDGPAVDGKGNIYSFDGETWENLYEENTPGEYDYNFIVSAVISSESVTASGSAAVAGEDVAVSGRRAGAKERRSVTLSSGAPRATAVSARSAMPATFPEVTSYRIYRSGSVERDVEATVSDLEVKVPTGSEYIFEVSAFYGQIESERSNKGAVYVGMENITDGAAICPTAFSGHVYLKGFDAVSRVEVVSVSGKVCLVVNHPAGEVIDTSSLSPGFYFFRIYDGNSRMWKVIRAVKTS